MKLTYLPVFPGFPGRRYFRLWKKMWQACPNRRPANSALRRLPFWPAIAEDFINARPDTGFLQLLKTPAWDIFQKSGWYGKEFL